MLPLLTDLIVSRWISPEDSYISKYNKIQYVIFGIVSHAPVDPIATRKLYNFISGSAYDLTFRLTARQNPIRVTFNSRAYIILWKTNRRRANIIKVTRFEDIFAK